MIYKYQKNGSIIGYDGALQVGYVAGRLKQKTNSNGDIENYSPFDELIKSGVEIAPYVEPVKTLEQLIAEIDLELSALDATPRMLSGALMGDRWAKNQIADNEIKQSALRDKRRALI
ncbi:MAG: hypothetical protein V7771_19020 [Shewanella psychromarinicola]|uniref:hypothetical protein n=1 Tax=Shewanella psychromarinicola TaxID=2487742 RepID=UPI00300233AA